MDWHTNKNMLASFKDHFIPYEGYGLDGVEPFPGGLFIYLLSVLSS